MMVWIRNFGLVCFFQEKYVGAVCANVFQKFPDFVQRCKDESFEALSDPVYSGKMKVPFSNKTQSLAYCGLFLLESTYLHPLFSGFPEAAEILSSKER